MGPLAVAVAQLRICLPAVKVKKVHPTLKGAKITALYFSS